MIGTTPAWLYIIVSIVRMRASLFPAPDSRDNGGYGALASCGSRAQNSCAPTHNAAPVATRGLAVIRIPAEDTGVV